MPRTLTVSAPAKVNLTLQVTGRRPDGYHLLDSIVVFAPPGDTLHFSESDELALSITGPYAAALIGDGDNLVLRAARALAEAAGCRPRSAIHLVKNLPVGSGIGGGSADAAAALRGLQELWQVSLPPERLKMVALSLGADVPVCLLGEPAHMQGIGEQLTPLPGWPQCPLLLASPGGTLLTKDVFAAFHGPISMPAPLPLIPSTLPALASLLRARSNSLQPAAMALRPEIAGVLAALEAQPGCLLARMSGSGPTCFGLFESDEACRDALQAVRAAQPGWWVAA